MIYLSTNSSQEE